MLLGHETPATGVVVVPSRPRMECGLFPDPGDPLFFLLSCTPRRLWGVSGRHNRTWGGNLLFRTARGLKPRRKKFWSLSPPEVLEHLFPKSLTRGPPFWMLAWPPPRAKLLGPPNPKDSQKYRTLYLKTLAHQSKGFPKRVPKLL